MKYLFAIVLLAFTVAWSCAGRSADETSSSFPQQQQAEEQQAEESTIEPKIEPSAPATVPAENGVNAAVEEPKTESAVRPVQEKTISEPVKTAAAVPASEKQKPAEQKAPEIPAPPVTVISGEPEKTETPVPEKITEMTKEDPVDVATYAQTSYVTSDDRYLHPWTANPVTGKTFDNQTVPWAGEELKFGIHYGFIRAGTAYIRSNGVTKTEFGPAYRIETIANSAKAIDAVFKVRDVNYSWISSKDYSSYGYSQSVREGGYYRDEWVSFNAPMMTYYGMVKRKKGPEPLEGLTTGPVQDMLTSLFYVRMQDLNTNKDIIFDVANREHTYPLVVKIIKREKVKVPAGTFNCVVVEPAFRGEGIFITKGKSLKVWLTDDERKMPVKMEAEVFIGSVSATLEEYKRK